MVRSRVRESSVLGPLIPSLTLWAAVNPSSTVSRSGFWKIAIHPVWFRLGIETLTNLGLPRISILQRVLVAFEVREDLYSGLVGGGFHLKSKPVKFNPSPLSSTFWACVPPMCTLSSDSPSWVLMFVSGPSTERRSFDTRRGNSRKAALSAATLEFFAFWMRI